MKMSDDGVSMVTTTDLHFATPKVKHIDGDPQETNRAWNAFMRKRAQEGFDITMLAVEHEDGCGRSFCCLYSLYTYKEYAYV